MWQQRQLRCTAEVKYSWSRMHTLRRRDCLMIPYDIEDGRSPHERCRQTVTPTLQGHKSYSEVSYSHAPTTNKADGRTIRYVDSLATLESLPRLTFSCGSNNQEAEVGETDRGCQAVPLKKGGRLAYCGCTWTRVVRGGGSISQCYIPAPQIPVPSFNNYHLSLNKNNYLF